MQFDLSSLPVIHALSAREAAMRLWDFLPSFSFVEIARITAGRSFSSFEKHKPCNMTNKNKKLAIKKLKKVSKEFAQAPDVLGPDYKIFSRAQLASLVFFSIGCSKLMELNTAYNEGSENPSSCVGYLGEQNANTCMHPSFTSLILAKYHSGLSLAGYLLSGMILLWDSEELFLRFMTCFTLSPVATTSFATILSQRMLERSRVWHLLIVSSVLYATIAPQSVAQIPFVTNRQLDPRTVQSMTLMGLLVFGLWEIAHVALNSESSGRNSLLQTTSPLPEAASSLVNFWIVDKFSMVLLYTFALFHFSKSTQRAFLFFVSIIKAIELFNQLTQMDESYHDEFLVAAGTFGLSLASALAWYV